MHSSKRQPDLMLETATKLAQLFETELGKENDLYIDASYLKAKAMFASASMQQPMNIERI
jgi:hypothetical protein